MARRGKPDPFQMFEDAFARAASEFFETIRAQRSTIRIKCAMCHGEFAFSGVQLPQACPFCGTRFTGFQGPRNGRQEQHAGKPARKRMNRAEAADFIFRNSGIMWTASEWMASGENREELMTAYRAAARKLHPDAGGSHEDFVKLQEAMEVLG